jgi:hypothetical protein
MASRSSADRAGAHGLWTNRCPLRGAGGRHPRSRRASRLRGRRLRRAGSRTCHTTSPTTPRCYLESRPATGSRRRLPRRGGGVVRPCPDAGPRARPPVVDPPALHRSGPGRPACPGRDRRVHTCLARPGRCAGRTAPKAQSSNASNSTTPSRRRCQRASPRLARCSRSEPRRPGPWPRRPSRSARGRRPQHGSSCVPGSARSSVRAARAHRAPEEHELVLVDVEASGAGTSRTVEAALHVDGWRRTSTDERSRRAAARWSYPPACRVVPRRSRRASTRTSISGRERSSRTLRAAAALQPALDGAPARARGRRNLDRHARGRRPLLRRAGATRDRPTGWRHGATGPRSSLFDTRGWAPQGTGS